MTCTICNKTIKQYGGSTRLRCGSCTTRIRRYRLRTKAVSYLGGRCLECGWVGHQSGYDFHHRDLNTKEFEISRIYNKSWNVVKVELDKCDLLCAVCHRIEHSKKTNEEDVKFLEAVKNYKGNI